MAERLVVVGIGEALFDCFGERAVLGGAPVNFAVHAHQLLAHTGGRGAVVSRVGVDALGDRLVTELGAWGVATDEVQRDPARPTGTVRVTLDEGGHPSYVIEEGVAWDAIEATPGNPGMLELARRCGAVCFGTLAQRSEKSRAAIRAFLAEAAAAIRLCDVNLRQHYFDAEVLRASLRAATVAKLSESEVPVVAGLLGVGEPNEPVDEQAWALREAFGLELVAVTRGERGTVVYTESGRVEGEVPRVSFAADADSVGAGDACDAGLVVGLLMGWPMERVVGLANEMGAFVASRAGATPVLSGELVRAWGVGQVH